MEKLLTVDEVADLLQVKPRTIYLWVHESYIPTVKLGACVRFHPASIAQWIKKKEAQGRVRRRYDFDLDIGVAPA
ncbi:MAG: helix-turn-helix domain-containing protein [Elusimicrobia bacterium]|nr:helix-turn-helix domain-containing protein [Elusimicrobiota bacterium]